MKLNISYLKKNVIFKGHVFYLFSCIQGALQKLMQIKYTICKWKVFMNFWTNVYTIIKYFYFICIHQHSLIHFFLPPFEFWQFSQCYKGHWKNSSLQHFRTFISTQISLVLDKTDTFSNIDYIDLFCKHYVQRKTISKAENARQDTNIDFSLVGHFGK